MRKFLIAAIVSVFGLCAPAMAEQRISLRGYDFANASDVVQLHDRLTRAARTQCNYGGDRSLAARQFERACQAAFMDEAIAKVSQPTVTAFYGALDAKQRVAQLGERAPQSALMALAAAQAQSTVIRSAATE